MLILENLSKLKLAYTNRRYLDPMFNFQLFWVRSTLNTKTLIHYNYYNLVQKDKVVYG